MKVRRKAFFRGLVLVMAFAMTILCFPLNALTAFAYFEDTGMDDTNYNYLLIGSNPVTGGGDNTSKGDVVTTVTKGDTYYIPFAYVGGEKEKILGRVNDGKISNESVSVIYNTSVLKDQKNGGKVKIYDETEDADEYKANYGEFVAENEGTYIIRYSYNYQDVDGHTYTNTYDLKVISTLPSASFNFKDNAQYFIPSVIDLKWAKTKNKAGEDTYRDLSLPMPELVDEDGETINLLKDGETEADLEKHFVTALPSEKTGRYVVVTATGGVEGGEVTVTKAEAAVDDGEGRTHAAGDLYINGDTFKKESTGAYNYTIKYSYYENGQFVAATTKETKLYPDYDGGNPYYKEYNLKLQFESSWNQNAGQTRVETTLPKPMGIVTNDGEDQQVDIRYTVKVYYNPNGTTVGQELDPKQYEDVLVEDVDNWDEEHPTYVLKDPTVFKPLENGTYNFVYTIYDFYGNSVSSPKETRYWRNIVDKKAPTPVLYDASDRTLKPEGQKEKEEDWTTNYDDATYKFKTRANPNSVVVYAIGIDDNYTTTEDFLTEAPETSKRKMIRRIRNDQETKFDIEEYHNKNLVFNYRTTTEASNAHKNLYTNNFLIQQKRNYEDFESDEDARKWLLENQYLLVLDNANAQHLFKLFKSNFTSVLTNSDDLADDLYADNAASFEEFLKKYSSEDATEAQKAILKTFKAEIEKIGFAYLPMNATFGATTNGATEFDDNIKGMGYGQYYIDYIVYDDAGNNQTSTKSIYVGSYTDSEAPTLTFATSLRDTYLPDATITFTAPTASDNGDSVDTNMRIETYYRYLTQDDSAGQKAITDLKDKDENVLSAHTLKQLYTDLSKKTDEVSKGYLADYASFLKEGEANGYIRLTDPEATSYTIDLNEVNTEARKSTPAIKIQIVTFVYDDSGNIAMYAVSANIANVIDNYAPWLEDAKSGPNAAAETYLQGQPITLPTLMFGDDKVAYLTYDVTVNHITTTKKDGQDVTTTTPVTVYGLKANRDENELTLTLSGGKFTPGSYGQYQARISVVDINNKAAVYFLNYYVTQKISIEEPKVTTSFDGAEIELDGDDNYDPEVGLEIDAPKVTYDIAESISYEAYNKLDKAAQSSAPKYIIKGVDENGAANDWFTDRTGRNQRFVATQKEVVDLSYTVNLLVYDRNNFEFAGRTIDPETGKPSPLGESGLFYVGNQKTKEDGFKFSYDYATDRYIFTTSEKTYEIYKDVDLSVEDEDKPLCWFFKVVDGDTAKKLEECDEFLTATGIEKDADFETNADLFFNGLTFYQKTLGPYTITVNDTKGPKFSSIYDDQVVFPTSLTRDEIKNGKDFPVPGIQASDRSGINLANSRITIRWSLAGGTDTGSETWYQEETLNNGGMFKINSNGSRLDGTYTFTYHVEDIYGNESELVKTITVGDVVAPEISVAESIVEENYKVGSELIIRYSDIDINDPGYGWDDSKQPVITLSNTSSGGDDIVGHKVEGGISFKLDQVGTYELKIEATDTHGNVGTWTKRITVSAKAQDSTTTYRVIGTVLIVVSVVVLAGVVIYFIVSKVKLDKELKKK